MHKSAYSVAVVGATGLVGTEIVTALGQRRFPIADLQLYASIRSAGDELQCGDVRAPVELLERARFDGTDLVFFAAGEHVSAEWIERATAAGAVVIDISPLCAADPDVPLVVPEVNAAELSGYTTRGIVASPDAPAIALAVALKPLADAAGLVRVVCSTFEPVCGAGRRGIEELQRQTIELMNGRSTNNEVFPHRIAFNILPHVGEFLAGGFARGEVHIVTGVRRLLADPALPVSVTCTRLPVFYGEALAVNVETARKLTATEARNILRVAPGVLLQDDLETGSYPTAADAVGQDATLVGRIREDESLNVLDFWLALDTLRKGAAVNAVQIAEVLIREYL
ncbi:MAG: asd-1 [Deltaproteobacteria bacterium]|nr:asd-1 [Deltaproteobacteria bacterium]